MSQRRQFRGWPERSGDIPWLVFGRELLRDFPCELRSLYVNLANPVGQIELAQHNPGTAERIGLNNVAACAEEVRVDVANDVRPAEHQYFAAVLFAPEIIQGGITLLDVGAHRAVVDDDAVLHSL